MELERNGELVSLVLSTTLVESGMGVDAELRCEGEKGWERRTNLESCPGLLLGSHDVSSGY